MSSTDNHRLESARIVLQECFWGDYKLSAEELLHRLEAGDRGFERFIFSKIIEKNSSHPSRHLRTLFAPHTVNELLQLHLAQFGDKQGIRRCREPHRQP
ncbi:hypothetical protein JCM31598_38560 [Desulfonatronum parangueonense]